MTPATTSDNIKTVEAIYAAFGRGDVGFILDQLTDDVDWASESESSVAPWYGRRSKAEVPEFFQTLADAVTVTEFTVLSMTSNDTDVMAVIRFAVTNKQTGKSGAMDLHHWWRLRDGKVCYYRGSEDTALTAELLSAEPEALRGRKDAIEWATKVATQEEKDFILALNDRLGEWDPVQVSTADGSTLPAFIGRGRHTETVTIDSASNYWLAFVPTVAGINLGN